MSSDAKAKQWFRKQMLIHQSSEKAKNAYKKIQQASLRQYTIEKYGVATSPLNQPLANVTSDNQSNFSDDVTQSFRGKFQSTPLRPARGYESAVSPRSSSPLRLETLRPLPHSENSVPQSTSSQQRELAKILRDQKAIQERSKHLVAQLSVGHAAQIEAENHALQNVVRDIAHDRSADQAALVDSIVDGALVRKEAQLVKSHNQTLAQANTNMYQKAVRATQEADDLREQLEEAQMQLKVCQKLYDTEQKNSLQSFSTVGQLKKELTQANNLAMRARVEHMEQIRDLEVRLAEETEAKLTAESVTDELRAAATEARSKMMKANEELRQSRHNARETRAEIASQLSGVLHTERELQQQNREVVQMLQEELEQEKTKTRKQEELLASTSNQLESYETALQDRLKASMDLEEEFHEKILQHKFVLEEVKHQKMNLQLKLTETAQEEVAVEAKTAREHFDAQRAVDRAEAAEQREDLKRTLEERHEVALSQLRGEQDTALNRLRDEHALQMERLKLQVEDEIKEANATALVNAREVSQDEVDALKVYPRKLQLEHQEKLDIQKQEAAQRLRELREQYEQELDIEKQRARQLRDEAQRAAERELEAVNNDWRAKLRSVQADHDSTDEKHRAEVSHKVRAEADSVRDQLLREITQQKQRFNRDIIEHENENAALRAQILSQKNEISSLTLHAASSNRTLESTWQAADSVFAKHRGALDAMHESEAGKFHDFETKAAAEMRMLRKQLLTAESDMRSKYQQELVERLNQNRMDNLKERNKLVQKHEDEKRAIYSELHDARLEAVKAAAAFRAKAQEESTLAMAQAQKVISAQREKDAVVKRALENQVSALRERQRQLSAQVERLLQIT